MMFREQDFLESQNDKATDMLYETSMQIRQYSLMLREQAAQQNEQLDDMGKEINKADKMLQKTMYNMKQMTHYKWPWIILLCIGLLIFWW